MQKTCRDLDVFQILTQIKAEKCRYQMVHESPKNKGDSTADF